MNMTFRIIRDLPFVLKFSKSFSRNMVNSRHNGTHGRSVSFSNACMFSHSFHGDVKSRKSP